MQLNNFIYERRNSRVLGKRWPLGNPAATMAIDFSAADEG